MLANHPAFWKWEKINMLYRVAASRWAVMLGLGIIIFGLGLFISTRFSDDAWTIDEARIYCARSADDLSGDAAIIYARTCIDRLVYTGKYDPMYRQGESAAQGGARKTLAHKVWLYFWSRGWL